jgi:hypothetical protein
MDLKLFKHSNILFFLLLFSAIMQGQMYTLDATHQDTYLRKGHIKVQPHPGAPVQFGVNSKYFEKDGRPWFPLMGEFHFVRYPHELWEEEIIKMKSAGLQIIATYIFWNAHEEPEGKWNWTGDRDLRKFLELCKKHNMFVWLRIGPWSHGEQLYGGHPKRINKMRGKRSNNPAYLKEVEHLFRQIGEQTRGQYYKEGGPILGVQLENEFATGKGEHIDTLKKMALKTGITPVFFSITANTVFNDKEFGYIPLQGAYPYRGWEKGGGGPTKDFLYGNDQWILSNALGKLFYDARQYPKGLCEQGCGSQVKYRNRFVVEPHVVEAHLQNQIGRGMNLIGYYMFHGGTQLPGLKEPGYPESYDFQAPVSEFGLLRPSYKYLKILHHFINDFGQELVQMNVVEPANLVKDERNTSDLRYVARVKGDSGFLFLNNTQVRIRMPDKKVRFTLLLPGEKLVFPKNDFLLKGETTAIMPFNLVLNSALLKYATAQPMSLLKNNNNQILFLVRQGENPVELAFDENTIEDIDADHWEKERSNGMIILTKKDNFKKMLSITDREGNKIQIRILSRKEAENSWRLKIDGKESLVITCADLMSYGDKIELRQLDDTDFFMEVYPRPEKGFMKPDKDPENAEGDDSGRLSVSVKQSDSRIKVKQTDRDKAVLTIPERLPENCSDVIVQIKYSGGSITAEINGKVVTDDLFTGQTWNFGLKRFILRYPGEKIVFKVEPWSNKITGIPEKIVKRIKRSGPEFEEISVHKQYKVIIEGK